MQPGNWTSTPIVSSRLGSIYSKIWRYPLSNSQGMVRLLPMTRFWKLLRKNTAMIIRPFLTYENIEKLTNSSTRLWIVSLILCIAILTTAVYIQLSAPPVLLLVVWLLLALTYWLNQNTEN